MGRTRIVRWLRVLLPLVALAMLSTMFLFSRSPEGESRIPFTEADGATLQGGMVAPEYSGVTDDGAQVTFRAARAVPGAGGGTAGDVALDWQRPDGLRAGLTAPRGALQDGVVRLEGGVSMTTSSGWQIDAPRIDAETGASVISADDGVQAVAPFGTLDAGRMRLEPGQDEAAPVLRFTDGVRLIYEPRPSP